MTDLSRITAYLGVPSLIALGLVWFVSTQVATQISDTMRIVGVNQRLLSQLSADRQLDRRLLRRICVNTSTTDSQREACLQ